MKSRQSRKHLAHSPSHFSLRWYGPNSPWARGRLVAVAMLADGQLNPAELREISAGVIATIVGLNRAQFMQVLFDLCEDIEKKLKPNGRGLLDQDILDQLLSEVSNPYIRYATLNAINLAISCDQKICSDEAKFLSHVGEVWGSAAGSQTEVVASTYVWLQPWEG